MLRDCDHGIGEAGMLVGLGWSYEEVLPYYMKSERARLQNADYRYHNTNGYQGVEDVYQSPLVEAFIQAGLEIGLPNWDYSTPTSSFGVSTVQATIRNGHRDSAARSFLWPIQNRPNLDIVTSAFVTKVLIDEQTRETYGVQYEKLGKTYKVLAKREVILSAGPKEHLEEFGIPVLQDSSVGQNLHDHLTFPGLSFLINQDIDLNRDRAVANIDRYIRNSTGPWTSLGGVEGLGYIKTSHIPPNTIQTSLDHIPNVVASKSISWLKLRSGNPYDRPLLYGNYFSDPNNEDIKTFIAAIRVVQRISATAAFQKYGSRLNSRPMAGCKHLVFDSDQYWECALNLLL
ncbi:hypothetical protein NQ314_000175 [Rhamnusium bicolor]|uniref:Glucose-methanol-choline oxidoreductase N-terminal domain-containing protein n=1 Tax=Rhamnusium bicolor TaxID=1586634 RepID=A0AAV8ZVJ7_9CUCU|nr:hypothetical protein NQ314_000175 [Rhamnusium bicolor]